ncbi:hypothetical protein [Aquihabitans sp. McL0605]|uniref:hypothetical protein n=1 Tax=Aquihabitans sp. McL0605 TaxID=3415671 RepID=UPI003CEF384F
MRAVGGGWVILLVAGALALGGCSADGGDAAEPAPKAATSTTDRASTTSATTSATRSSSTSTSAAPSTTVAAEPIPWSQVAVAGHARTGRLSRITDVVQDDTGERLGSGRVSQTVIFDRDRGLLAGAIGVTEETGARTSIEFNYSKAGMFMAGADTQERCGAKWVAVDPGVVQAAGLDAVDVHDLAQLGPFAALDQVGDPEPTVTTLVGSTFEVELPASLGVAPSYLVEHPGSAEGLARRTTAARVTIEHDLDTKIEQWLPFAVLAAAGGDDAGPAGDHASIHTLWDLQHVDEPVTIEVPTDVAADPSCAAGG